MPRSRSWIYVSNEKTKQTEMLIAGKPGWTDLMRGSVENLLKHLGVVGDFHVLLIGSVEKKDE